MSKQAFEKELRTALHEAPQAHSGQARTAALARTIVAQRGAVVHIGFAEFLGEQMRFIGWKIWLMQALVLITLNALLHVRFSDHYILYPSLAARLLCCCSVLVLATALPFMHNATLYRMHEVEAATRFSSLRLLAAKLVLIGIGDVVMLGGILVFSLYQTPLSLPHTLLCLTLPFLLAASGSLRLLRHLHTSRFYLASGIWCTLLCAVSLCGGRWLTLAVLSPLWLLLTTALLLICGYELYQLFRRSAFSELQLN